MVQEEAHGPAGGAVGGSLQCGHSMARRDVKRRGWGVNKVRMQVGSSAGVCLCVNVAAS